MRHALFAILVTATLTACGSEAPAPSEPNTTTSQAVAPVAAAPEAYSGPMVAKADLAKQPCLLSPAEIEMALGFAVAAGVPDTTRLDSYGMAGCVYDGKSNSVRLTVFWLEPSQVAAARTGMTRMSGGGQTELLQGDPDSAYLHDQQDNGTSLHYLRQNLRVQVHATSGMVPFATMKPKLLALRRVP